MNIISVLKRITICFMLGIFIIQLSASFNCNADDAKENEPIIDKVRIEDIIKEGFNEDLLKEIYYHDTRYLPDEYTVDSSKYIAEIFASIRFLDKFEDNNRDLKEYIRSQGNDPALFVYIPLYGEVEGNNRVIGHVALRKLEGYETYKTDPVFMNTKDADFLSGNRKHFCEILEDLKTSGEIERDADIVLIRLFSAYNDVSEKIAMYESNGELYVVDFYNSVRSKEPKLIYTYDEYYPLRKAVEEELFSDEVLSWQAGGVVKNSNISLPYAAIIITSSVISVFIIFVIVGLITFIIKSKKKAE